MLLTSWNSLVNSSHKLIEQPLALYRHLSIRNKIGCGYALTIGVAVLGTITGLTISNNQLQQARKQMVSADAERGYITKIQTEVLQTRLNQQQIIFLLENSQELEESYVDFLRDLTELETLFAEFPSTIEPEESKILREMIEEHHAVLQEYWVKAEANYEKNDLLNLQPDELLLTRQVLIEFGNSDVARQLDQLSQHLESLAEEVDEKEKSANLALAAAEVTRTQILTVSILLSIACATLLALFTSRAIAQPLKTTTEVAQRVTQEGNFYLQVPVMAEDEVGILAKTLNQLISQVEQLLAEQKAEATRQLMQNEKMASLGRMLAGIVHEINNPINCVYGNLTPLNEYIKDLSQLLEAWESSVPQPPATVNAIAQEIDLDFLKQDLPKLLDSMQFGAVRARQILLSLKDFSRLDTIQPSSVNLHDCLESTLLILHSRVKKGVTVTRNYGEIPAIEGYTGFLYQVFMNLLSNALDALEDVPDPEITITTKRQGSDWVTICIRDNGCGIVPENQEKIFESFFTTKPRGVGTGLGLALSHQIVVEKHGGQLTVESKVNQGTEFIVTLPKLHSQQKQGTARCYTASELQHSL